MHAAGLRERNGTEGACCHPATVERDREADIRGDAETFGGIVGLAVSRSILYPFHPKLFTGDGHSHGRRMMFDLCRTAPPWKIFTDRLPLPSAHGLISACRLGVGEQPREVLTVNAGPGGGRCCWVSPKSVRDTTSPVRIFPACSLGMRGRRLGHGLAGSVTERGGQRWTTRACVYVRWK